MAVVTDYSTLQTWVENVLNRTDLQPDVQNLIQDAEARLRRDSRARLLVDLTPFTLDAEDVSLPGDFSGFADLSYHGSAQFGPIEVVPLDHLGQHKASFGETGVPRFVGIIESGANAITARFAPAPDQTYTLNAAYWARPTHLSDTNSKNRFLTEHPDIYKYAVLVEAGFFLKDDERVAGWEQQLNERLTALKQQNDDKHFSGTLSMRPRRVI